MNKKICITQLIDNLESATKLFIDYDDISYISEINSEYNHYTKIVTYKSNLIIATKLTPEEIITLIDNKIKENNNE